MSSWAFESDESLAPSRSSVRPLAGEGRAKPRRAFFGGDSDGEQDVRVMSRIDNKRDSLTLASTSSLGSRRSQRHSRTELVVDDSDDGYDDHAVGVVKHTTMTKSVGPVVVAPTAVDAPTRIPVVVTAAATRNNSKSDEIAGADIVRRTSELAVESPAASTLRTGSSPSSQYVHWLVRDFLEKQYPRAVVEIFDKEHPTSANATNGRQVVEALHARLTASVDTSSSSFLEHTLVAWDARTHKRQLVRSRSRRKESVSVSASDPLASSPAAALSVETTVPETGDAAGSTTLKPKNSSGSRKKPQLSVTIASDAASTASDGMAPDDGDFNRLNHPGHTPKAQDALLAAVIGKPGSTPKANASELKALGFDDIDDEHALGPLIPTPSKPDVVEGSSSSDDDADGLSKYARRKRAARRHDKHVYIGEPGGTPTKEYVFFRETPPRFVTETVEDAEEALRTSGGNPDVRRQQLLAAKMERFVELQSSDVAKYAIGQRVENLGAQRNVSGLVSKLYGSRQCGTAGPGTVVIDTWNGSDTAPMLEGELLSVASRPSTPASSR